MLQCFSFTQTCYNQPQLVSKRHGFVTNLLHSLWICSMGEAFAEMLPIGYN